MADIARRWAASYRVRLAVGFLLVIALFASAWAWSLFGPLTDAVVEQHGENLRAVAQAGALVLAESTQPPQTTVDRLVARTNLRMTVIAADGAVLADSEEAAGLMENHADRPEVAAALSGDAGFDRRQSSTQGTEQLYVAVPASHGGERVALRVSEPLTRINDAAVASRRTGLALLAVALVIATFVVVRITAVASEPIRRMSEVAHTMARGNLTVDVPEEAGDLRVLSSALSDLREQMQRRLVDLEAEQRTQRTVLDGLADAVFLLHDAEIRFANSAAGRMFSAPPSGWRGKRLAQTGLPASVTDTLSTAHDDSPAIIESGPDPSGRYLRTTVLPLNPTDAYRRTLVVVSDITERTHIDQVRRDFVANASHELKTPTAAIHLLAESIATAAHDGDTGQAMVFASQIAQESERLNHLVRDLLDLSRLESTPAEDSVTDIRKAIANALLGHRVPAAKRGLEMTADDSAIQGRDVYVLADPTDVAIALDNLLDNAITYTERGSVSIAASTDETSVSIAVTDTGPGIPAADLPRIFERFYRVDRARSRDSGGTGLGLALVRHVAERSGGSVHVSSEPGTGSTFTLVLPRAS